MTFGLPQNLAPRLIAKSFQRVAHVAAFVFIGASATILLSFQVWAPGVLLWPAAVALIPMVVTLALLDRRRTRVWALAYLAASALGVGVVTFAVVSQFDLERTADLLAYPYLKIAAVLVGGISVGRLKAVYWSTAGYVVAEASAASAIALAGVRWGFDAYTAFLFSLTILLIVLSGLEGQRGRRAESRLRRAAHDEVAAAVVYRVEQRASAILHDTVLGHLSTISYSPDGPISSEQREQLQRDLELVGHATLGATLDAAEPSSTDAAEWHDHPIYLAIRDARASGLDVDVTGDPEASFALSPHNARIVALAVGQCLVNIAKHSGVLEAEVAVHPAGADVMIMVIDGGRGFDPDAVGSDRLGLRNSIRGRIESIGGSVQVWTGLGKGTSVVMQAPAGTVVASETPENDFGDISPVGELSS